jgi:hypothetical protein
MWNAFARDESGASRFDGSIKSAALKQPSQAADFGDFLDIENGLDQAR